MKRQKSTERIPAGLPENTVVAHKTGSIKGVRNDAGIVYAPTGPYVIALYAKGLEDEKRGVDALAELSRAAWSAFGPRTLKGRHERTAERRARRRPDARHVRALLHDDAGRHGRRCHQDRAARPRR